MLTESVKTNFYQMIQVGCFFRVVPFKWDSKKKRFLPPSTCDMGMFRLYEAVIYTYTVVGVMKFLIHRNSGREFPLMEKLLSIIWTFAFTITSAALMQLRLRQKDIMQFANRIFELLKTPKSGKAGGKQVKKNPVDASIEEKARKNITLHMYIALFLLSSNPSVHSLIISSSPCTPFYTSSSYFSSSCESFDKRLISFLENAPFLAFESYAITMFLYLCSFFWSFIFLGLGDIETNLQKLKAKMTKVNDPSIVSLFRDYREVQVLVAVLNDSFCFFLMTFPIVLLSICSLLMYGTIRLWHVDPQSNLMFPLCGIRCGFEALTPLQMAGRLNSLSASILEKWKKMRKRLLQGPGRYQIRLLKRVQRSCANLQCTSGSMYTFENSIVLCSLNNCLQLTLNLLVSFGKYR